MSATLKPHSGQNPTIIAEIPGVGIQLASGPTVPTDGGAGYGIGCLFIHNDSTTPGQMLYCNEGTLASCDFDAVSVA